MVNISSYVDWLNSSSLQICFVFSTKQQEQLMQEVQQANMEFTQMRGSAGGDRERFLK